MATLQKFKFLAMQCGGSRSPTRSPVVHLRRRKTTLRMLLGRRRKSELQRERLLEKEGRDLVRRHSLKDLFVASPPGEDVITNDDNGSNVGLDGSGFRYRSLLSKKAWRPILLTVAEDKKRFGSSAVGKELHLPTVAV